MSIVDFVVVPESVSHQKEGRSTAFQRGKWCSVIFTMYDQATKKMPILSPQPQKARQPPLARLRVLATSVGRRRVRPLLQMTEVECGLTCLAMVLAYYGRKVSVSDLRLQFGTGRDGASALNIVKAARHYGLRVRALSLQHSEFRHMTLPAIVHWEFNHFVVVERWTPKWVDIVDPATGRRRLTAQEFDTAFTGIVVTLEPGANFQRRSASSAITLRSYIIETLKRTPGAMLQVLLASIFLQIFGLVLPLLTKVVVDQILPLKIVGIMNILAIAMILVLCSQGVTTLVREWVLVYLRTRIDIQMMLGFFEHLFSLPYTFFQQRSTGDLLTRMGSNNIIRDAVSSQLIGTLLDGTMVILYLFILFWLSLPFTILTLVVGLLQILIVISTAAPMNDLMKRELAAQGKSQGYMAEALAGVATIKAAGAEHQALERWSNLFFEQLNISIRRSYISSVIGVVMGMLRSFSPLALLWIGALQVLNNTMTIGTMLALTALASVFLDSLGMVVGRMQQLQLVNANVERLVDITTAEPEQYRDKVQVPPRLKGQIRLENVFFRYSVDSAEVLRNITMTIPAGQKIAIVGRTGSGKSTLGKLLLGLYPPTKGTIYYDELPLQHLQYQEVRRQFGVVLQDTTIFSGTLLQNITLNNPMMPKERAIQAAEVAAIHDDVMKMPMGYETFIGEGGCSLSGGQRQRIAIARAVAHSPSVLLLDEATSNLDVITEQRVTEHLDSFACTQIIIAHRLSTIRKADLILVLDQGTIVEQGNHDELLQNNGYYARLVQQQLMEKKERKSGFYRVNLQQLTS
jgi:ATP-binding cassette subfamily B protein